jgi:hypothetical protein
MGLGSFTQIKLITGKRPAANGAKVSGVIVRR